MKTLVAGWFSFHEGHATAGDFVALDLTRRWLDEAGCAYDVASVLERYGGIDWRTANPDHYSQVVFVCGPFGRGEELELAFLERFRGRRLIGLNLSMMEALDVWNPFDLLLERDSSVTTRPDIVFLAPRALVPLAGICLVEAYDGALTDPAHAAVGRLVASARLAVVNIDTRLDVNAGGLRTGAEIESVIARMDVLITTRLHGLVFALKNGVPALAIDPEPGGGKILRQAQAIGWPLAFSIVRLSDDALREALAYALSAAARSDARACGRRAAAQAAAIHTAFVASVRNTPRAP